MSPVANSFENPSAARGGPCWQAAVHEQEVRADQARRPEQARLVDEHGVDEVGVCRGQNRGAPG